MKLGVILAALAGLALAAWLVFHVGFSSVLGAVASVGWAGFAILCVFQLALFAVLGAAWYALMPGARMAAFIWARMVRDSAGEVLPFSQFGGILIGARALVLNGYSAPAAFASSTVDLTTELMAQIVLLAIGIGIFVARFGIHSGELPDTTLAGIAFVIAGSIAFIVLQRRGVTLASSLAARLFPAAEQHTQAFGRELEVLYQSPARLASSSFVHLIGWIASSIATWLTIRLIGGHIDIAGAIAIESILCALRSAAVVVPGALGVQEAGYALLLPLFGLPAEMGLAVSLLKRAREIVIGVPVLLAWQGMEGRRAFAAPKT
ncbi:MAG: lysylphosphatidylglycerol synthase domain-containing protein [Rhizomicrobium sp.]